MLIKQLGKPLYYLGYNDAHRARLRMRIASAKPVQVGQLPARQSRCYSRSNSPANEARDHRRRAHKGPGPNSRRRTEIELLNRAALNVSRPLDEAAKRMSDRGTIPTSIDHGFRRLDRRGKAGAIQATSGPVKPTLFPSEFISQ